MSKIVQLEAENVKRLRAVQVRPDGSLVVVGGNNGQGKTSLLDSIAMALGGKDLVPVEPLRRGADKGHVEVTLDDGTVIRRTFTPAGGGALTVTNKEGARYGSPQKLLDGLVGRLSFDPLAFSRMEPRAQAETVRALAGADFSQLDGERQKAFDARTEVHREVKRLEGALAKLPPATEGTPDAEVSVDELAAELERRRELNAAKTEGERRLDAKREKAIAARKRVEELERQLAAAREDLERMTTEGKALAEEVIAMPFADEAEVLEQLKSVQATNAAVRTAAERKRLEAELEQQHEKALDLTGAIQAVDDAKRERLAAAKLPVDGLAFTDAGVTLGGLPLEQASSAEQLRVSVAIGLAMHPKLKVLLVRDGSLLDEQSLALVARMAEEAGAQVWVERVGKGAECSVVIEDGQVVAAATAPQKGNGKPQQGRLSVVREPGEEG